jgi:hypothetical protein
VLAVDEVVPEDVRGVVALEMLLLEAPDDELPVAREEERLGPGLGRPACAVCSDRLKNGWLGGRLSFDKFC